jgi:phage major head subunit gpT-like protein
MGAAVMVREFPDAAQRRAVCESRSSVRAEEPREIPLAASFQVEAVQAASADGRARNRRFTMVAYTGGPMRIAGFSYPVVVDLAGLDLSRASFPVFVGHQQDPDHMLGQADRVEVVGTNLVVSGEVIDVSARAKAVVEAHDRGFRWQASIGAAVLQREFVPEGRTVNVNGAGLSGPLIVARKAELGEISFVFLGADRNTSATIAARTAEKESNVMDETRNDTATQGKEAPATQAQAAGGPEAGPSATAAPPVADPAADIRAAALAETNRIAAIREVCAGRHADIEAKAIEEGWDACRAELEVLRAERPKAPAAHIRDSNVDADILAAAVCLSGSMKPDESRFDEKVLDAAGRRFRSGIGLQELIMEAAWANGWSGWSFRSDMEGCLRAAFSTFRLPGILSNVANKFLLAGFESVEDAWKRVAATRSVRDFKAVTSYRLTGAFEYEEVGPTGELKHGAVDEETFTNQAKTYGRMFSITRTDLINDDLGALTALPRKIGRGGALKLNKVFWTAFLNNAAFFTTARGNYKAGADTALSVDGLTDAELLFLEQKDAEGSPLGVTPRVLLVPPALLVRGTQLMNSTELRDTTANTKYVTSNPHAGKFSVVHSAYLSNAGISGYSAKAWYLLADPEDLPVVEVAFLNGQQTPTVERADADFNVLGIQFRGYFDFGVALQDWRAGVKMKGEA